MAVAAHSLLPPGFNPVWNECLRHVLYFPELALVHFCVMDHDIGSQDDFIGQFTLPFASMTTGETQPLTPTQYILYT